MFVEIFKPIILYKLTNKPNGLAFSRVNTGGFMFCGTSHFLLKKANNP